MIAVAQPSSSPDALAAWSQFATLVIAVGAAILAFLQIRASRRQSRESSANEIFREYMKIAFDHPRFANPRKFDSRYSPEDFEKYEWFVGIMLWACDEVLRNVDLDKSWNNTILDHLKNHDFYISSSRFRNEFFDHHGERLKLLIDKISAGTANHIPPAALQAHL